MNDAFEKQLRDAWAKQDFPVDPEHRAAMEALLRKRDRRRPLIFWWLGGLLLLVVGAAGLVWFATRNVAHAPLGSDVRVTNEAGSPSIDKAVTPDLSPGTEARLDVKEPGASGHPKVSRDQAKMTDESATSIPDDQVARGAGLKSAAKPEAASSTKKKTDRKQPAIASATHVPGESGTGAIAQGPTVLPDVDQGKREDNLVGLPVASSIPLGKEQDSPVDAGTDIRTPSAVEPIAGLDAPVLETGSPEVIVAAGVSSQRRWYLFAETAGTYIPANEPQSPVGWQLHAGAGAGFSLLPRLEGLVSAGYMLQDGGFSFSKSSTVRQLGFGVRSAFNTLAPDRLHHLYLKAGVQYRIRRHILSARAGVCYLYGAQGDITVVQADQLSSGTVEQTTRTWVNPNGLRRVFGVADLGYGYQLTPALSAIAGLTWRPSPVDRTDDALADEGYIWNGNVPAWQGFLSLQYRFYGKH